MPAIFFIVLYLYSPNICLQNSVDFHWNRGDNYRHFCFWTHLFRIDFLWFFLILKVFGGHFWPPRGVIFDPPGGSFGGIFKIFGIMGGGTPFWPKGDLGRFWRDLGGTSGTPFWSFFYKKPSKGCFLSCFRGFLFRRWFSVRILTPRRLADMQSVHASAVQTHFFDFIVLLHFGVDLASILDGFWVPFWTCGPHFW